MTDLECAQVSEVIANRTGIRVSADRCSELECTLSAAARELGIAVPSLVRRLLAHQTTREELKVLASHLTVGETYFFRDPAIFEVLENCVLPGLISSRTCDRHLRVWSAGCSTGEEAYSIAIVLDRLLPDLQHWNVTLLATDVNVRALQKAAEGVYSDWSFRGVPSSTRDKYFTRVRSGRYAIQARIRRMVSLGYLNLAEETYPSLSNNTNGMDLIFCRNVLMYFCAQPAQRVVGNFWRALVDEGWLVVSPSETSAALFSAFTVSSRGGAILYRKVEPEPASTPLLAQALEHSAIILETAAAPGPGMPGVMPKPAHASEAEDDPRQLAAQLYGEGRYHAVAESLERWLAAHPDDASAMTLLARAQANLGQLSDALKWIDTAISRNRLDPVLHYLRATVLGELGSVAEAVGALKQTLYLDAECVLAHFGLAVLARRRGKLRESQKHRENALALLQHRPPQEILPDSEGMTAGRLWEMLRVSLGEVTS